MTLFVSIVSEFGTNFILADSMDDCTSNYSHSVVPYQSNSNNVEVIQDTHFTELKDCKIMSLSSDYQSSSSNAECNIPSLGLAWTERLLKLLKLSIHAQYELACLSTLGGAYHLCDRPRQALQLAKRQEAVGRRYGIHSVTVRSKVFQAVNYGLLGKTKKALKLFADSRKEAENSDGSLLKFCDAAKSWLLRKMDTSC